MNSFKTSSILLIIVAACVLAACSPQQETSETASIPYPLDECIVTGEALGSMGDAYVFVHEGQEIKLCCKSCLKDFNKEPEQYLAKLKQDDSLEPQVE